MKKFIFFAIAILVITIFYDVYLLYTNPLNYFTANIVTGVCLGFKLCLLIYVIYSIWYDAKFVYSDHVLHGAYQQQLLSKFPSESKVYHYTLQDDDFRCLVCGGVIEINYPERNTLFKLCLSDIGFIAMDKAIQDAENRKEKAYAGLVKEV